MKAETAALRRFTRFYTHKAGTLREHLLDSPYSLTETRVLFELATRGQASAQAIAAELGLDPGYLSRLVRKFEAARLLRRKTSPQDRRELRLTLTPQGRRAFALVNQRAEKLAQELLAPLTAEQQSRLIRSMQTIEDLLGGAHHAPYVLRPHRAGDMGWVVSRQAALYSEEYGWDSQYEALASRIVADFLDHFDAQRERCWIAERDGDRLGCIFLVKHPERSDLGKLRLLHVEKAARGQGLGRTLVRECVSFARSAGYRQMTLWTQSVLRAAIHLYQQAGFVKVHEAPHHSFGVDLVEQTWELALAKNG